MGSGLSQEDLDEKNVVIIGGGFAGTQLASNLAKKGIPFVLIDPKDHFHYTIGALRAAVHPEFIKNILIDYRKTYGDHQFIQAKVVNASILLQFDFCRLIRYLNFSINKGFWYI